MITILLVDDQPDFLQITRLFLEKGGVITVDTAESAEEALSLIRVKKYDAVVSDYEMPEMDGIAFLTELMRQGIDKPFIIFTGRSREDVVIRALNTGADFYLQKGGDASIQYAELQNMIQQAVMRKRMEEALIRAEINYRTIVESTKDSIYMVDKNGRYLFMNTHHMRRLGITGYYEGRTYGEFHTPAESERFATMVANAIETGNPVQEEYLRDDRWFIRKMSPVRNETLERVFAVIVISAEVTEQRQMEEALRVSEKNYRIVVEAASDSIYTVDPEGGYIFMNSHHRKRLGISEGEDIQSRHYHEFHDPTDTEKFLISLASVVTSRESLEDRYSSNRMTIIRKMYPIMDAREKQVISVAVISIDTGRR